MERKRIITLFVIFLIPLAGIGAKLFWLQCLESQRFAQEFESYIYDVEVMPPGRGRIVARDGTPLATETRAFNLFVILSEFDREPRTRLDLAGVLAHPEGREGALRKIAERIAEIEAVIDRMAADQPASNIGKVIKQERRTPWLLWEDVEFRVAMLIETHPEIYSGVIVRETFRRVYPQGKSASHIVGYLGKRTQSEYKSFLETGELNEYEEIVGEYGVRLLEKRGVFMNDLLGRTGIEKSLDRRLRGKSGINLNERNVFRKTREVIGSQRTENGEDVTLTIDLPLQRAAEAALSGRRGAAVVLDVRNGEVLALASLPGFDPNDLTPPVSRQVYEGYMNDSAKPLINRAVSGVYQLGSIFKAATATAALESGKVTAETRFECQGRLYPSKDIFKCWIARHGSAHGDLTMPEALARSCNIYFFKAAQTAGEEALVLWAGKLGYGEATGIDLPGEQDGILPSPQWLKKRQGRKWEAGETLNLAIGQGYLTATPLQAAVMMAAIANGGRRVIPHVVKGEEKEPVELGISQGTIETIRKGLTAVVHESYGTAHNSDLKLYPAAGKTSSAQTGGSESHAWFAGYTPTDAPRYAFVVIVEHGGAGGEVAAPVAAKIVETLQKMGASE